MHVLHVDIKDQHDSSGCMDLSYRMHFYRCQSHIWTLWWCLTQTPHYFKLKGKQQKSIYMLRGDSANHQATDSILLIQQLLTCKLLLHTVGLWYYYQNKCENKTPWLYFFNEWKKKEWKPKGKRICNWHKHTHKTHEASIQHILGSFELRFWANQGPITKNCWSRARTYSTECDFPNTTTFECSTTALRVCSLTSTHCGHIDTLKMTAPCLIKSTELHTLCSTVQPNTTQMSASQ